jgi:protein pelota
VASTDFDPAAGQLHVSGKVAEANQHVALGSFHTLDLELHRNFTIEKADGWDSVAIETLRESVQSDKNAQLWAVVMQEGLANICQITEHQTVFRQAVRQAVPHKRSGASDHEKAMGKFHATLLSTLLRQIDLPATANANSKPSPLLIASPAFYAANFVKYVKEEATRTTNKALLAYIPSIITAHAASGHMSALQEALASPALRAKLADTKYARETLLMDRFYELMRNDDLRAWYGPKEVERAVEKGGVGRGGGVLLISDALFRSLDIGVRKRWVTLVDRVRDVEGGEVRVLSSAHESGKRLEALGGIAAILTFPMPDLEEEEEPEENNDGIDVQDNPDDVNAAEQGVEELQL